MPVPRFYMYPMPTGPGLSFLQGMQTAEEQGLKRKEAESQLATQELQRKTAQQTMEQSAQLFPYKMEEAKLTPQHLQAQINKINDDVTLTPAHKILLINQAKQAAAEAELKKTQTEFTPITEATKAAQVLQSGSRFGAAYQMSRTLGQMDASTRAKWIADNQSAYNDMLATMGNKELAGQSNAGNAILIDLLTKKFGTPKVNLPQMPSKEISKDQISLPEAPPPGAQLTGQVFTSTKNEADKLADTGKFTALQKQWGNQLKARVDAAKVLDSWFTKNRADWIPRINRAIEYAGLKGRGKRYLDEWLNKNPTAIADYDWLKNQFGTNNINQIMMMEKMGATDMQRKEAHTMQDAVDNVASNPLRAKMAINNMFRMIRSISDAIYNGAEDKYSKGLIKQYYGIPEIPGDYLEMSPVSSDNRVRVVSPDGKSGSLPKEQLDAALKAGYKIIQ